MQSLCSICVVVSLSHACIHRYICMLPKHSETEACEAPTYERPLCSDTSNARGAISAASGGGHLFQRKKNINDSETGFVGWQECFWCLAGFGSTATGLVPRKQQTATPAGEASLTTFVQTWCIEAAYMAETMAPSHVANTPLSSRCEVECAKTHQCSLSWQSESAESSLQHIEHQWTVYQTRRMSKARPLAYA